MKLSNEEREEFLARVFPVWYKEPKEVPKAIHSAEQFAAEAIRQTSWDEDHVQFHGEIF